MYEKSIILRLDKSLGYEYFIDNSHPLANSQGKVYHHRHILSLKLGRWISKDESVHHIDGNRLNNNPDNLECLSRSEHGKIHNGAISVIIHCPICNNVFNRNGKYCSIECYGIARRVVKDRPSKECLIELTRLYSYSAIGRMYNVSDNTIRKWLK